MEHSLKPKGLKRRHSFENFAARLATSLCNGKQQMDVKEIFSKMEERGILSSDPRLKELHLDVDDVTTISKLELTKIIPKNLEIFKLLSQKLAIPDFVDFKQRIKTIYDETKKNKQGNVAKYIPQIAKQNPDHFAVSICTIDGQQLHLGDYQQDFTVQSCCKIVNYCIALEQHGADVVHKYVGKEPSGKEFNAITLDKNKLPHNPCTNAGAIMICSLIGRETIDIDIIPNIEIVDDDDDDDNNDNDNNEEKNDLLHSATRRVTQSMYLSTSGISSPIQQQATFEADRWELLNQIWKKLFAGSKIGFNNSVYLSEKSTGHRNYALGHFMYEQDPGFPSGTHLKGVMEFYFQSCALEVTAKKLSYVAATLANGGVNPLTGERIFSHETVKNCLSVMFMCGMYDYSGEFAFKVGIPSKSGVSGAVISIIPNVMGICTFSPPLDGFGNSVRGSQFLEKISEQFAFHHFDNIRITQQSAKKMDTKSLIMGFNTPKCQQSGLNSARSSGSIDNTNSIIVPLDNKNNTEIITFKILSYAAAGDLHALQRMDFRGCNLNCNDYDDRTPLHLAASCGHTEIVKFLMEIGSYNDVNINELKDRWGGTPYDDAVREGHECIVEYFHSKQVFSINGQNKGISQHKGIPKLQVSSNLIKGSE